MVDAEARARIAELEESNRQLRYWVNYLASLVGKGSDPTQIHSDIAATGGAPRPQSLGATWGESLRET